VKEQALKLRVRSTGLIGASNFNAVLETGNLMPAEEVKIHSEIQLVKQAALAAA
jgi:hypothetical protein